MYFKLQITWYGFMYVLSYFLIENLSISVKKILHPTYDSSKLQKMCWYVFVFGILGACFFNVLIYDRHNLHLLTSYRFMSLLIRGGKSFFGGIIGAVIVIAWVDYKHFFVVSDVLLTLLPLGIMLVRIVGSYTSHEFMQLVVYNIPLCIWAGLTEGAFCFALMLCNLYYRFANATGLFLIAYGSIRFCNDICRMNIEESILSVYTSITVGQVCAIISIVVGICIVLYHKRINLRHDII